MIPNFKGIQYHTATKWFPFVDVKEYQDRPIHYLEIGVLCGASLISVAQTYGAHKDSQLVGIDPWEDYEEYPQYKKCLSTMYASCLENLKTYSSEAERITLQRGYSHQVIQTFPDNTFDIIYVDGNHQPDYVLEDAVLSFRKLKVGGILIFDDYGFNGPIGPQRGIEAFLTAYSHRIVYLGGKEQSQVFVRKVK